MLVDVESKVFKNINYKIDENIVNEFRRLCKKHKIKQSHIIKNALKKAIEELEVLDDDK